MSFILIVSLLGIWLFLSRVLAFFVNRTNTVGHSTADVTSILQAPLLSWLLTLGFVGGLSNIFYYLNGPHTYACAVVISVGMICILICSKNLIEMTTKFPERISNIVVAFRSNILFFACILFLIFLYVMRAGAPWYDQDEIAYYGYLTKLIANGWTHSDISDVAIGKHGFPVLGEVMFAPFYWASGDMILGRVFRVFTLTLTAMFFFQVVSYHTRSRLVALTATGLLLITPEFAWRATSMKVDIILFFFEISSLLLFSLAAVARSDNPKKYSERDLIFLLSIVLAIAAFSVRVSGVYTLIIIISYYLVTSIWSKRYMTFIRSNVISFLLAGLLLWGYFANLALYQNPFFPVGGPWLSIFPDSMFVEDYHIETLKSTHNLVLVNNLVEFLYLPIHLALGLETTIFDQFTFIPHPIAKSIAYGWANPMLFLIFLPILFFRNPHIMKLYIPLLFGYWFWFSSIQYSRMLLGWSAFLLLVLAIIVSTKPNYKKVALSISASVILVFTIYHSIYSFHRYPNTVGSFFLAHEAQESNYRALDRLSSLMGIGKQGDFRKSDESFIAEVNKMLETIDKPTIAVSLPRLGFYNHIFFKKGKFLKYIEPLDVTKFDCLLSVISEGIPKPETYREIAVTTDKEFWCAHTET